MIVKKKQPPQQNVTLRHSRQSIQNGSAPQKKQDGTIPKRWESLHKCVEELCHLKMIQSLRNVHTLCGRFSHPGCAKPASLTVHLQLKQRYNQATKPLFFLYAKWKPDNSNLIPNGWGSWTLYHDYSYHFKLPTVKLNVKNAATQTGIHANGFWNLLEGCINCSIACQDRSAVPLQDHTITRNYIPPLSIFIFTLIVAH